MKYKITLIVLLPLLFLGFVQEALAQQEPQYTQYMYNTQVINPAYAGTRGSLSILGLYRTQWVGLDGAPKTANFSLNSPIGIQGIGVGLSVMNDKIGPQESTQVTADIAYQFPINDRGTMLSFGMKAGANIIDIDGNKLNWYNPNDPSYDFIVRHSSKPVIGAGFFLYNENWYLGLSTPNFLTTSYYDDVKVSVYNSKAHFYLQGGYVFNITDNFKLKPAAILKAVSGAPLSGDVSLNALFANVVTVGAGYRWDSNDAINAMAGLQVTNRIMVGYAYDFQTGDLAHYNNGSHEIFLRFELGTRLKPKVNPRFF